MGCHGSKEAARSASPKPRGHRRGHHHSRKTAHASSGPARQSTQAHHDPPPQGRVAYPAPAPHADPTPHADPDPDSDIDLDAAVESPQTKSEDLNLATSILGSSADDFGKSYDEARAEPSDAPIPRKSDRRRAGPPSRSRSSKAGRAADTELEDMSASAHRRSKNLAPAASGHARLSTVYSESSQGPSRPASRMGSGRHSRQSGSW